MFGWHRLMVDNRQGRAQGFWRADCRGEGIEARAGLLLFWKKVTKKLLSGGWQKGLSDWGGMWGQALVGSYTATLIDRLMQAGGKG